jgi:hypothetical protein
MDTSFGYHDWKFGFEYYDMDILGAINYAYPGGEYIRTNQFGQGMYRWVLETDVPKRVGKTAQTMTFFVQDKWEVTKGLTLNLGFRFEGGKWNNDAGEEIVKWNLMDMFAPRLGVAYSFGKNKFHANWGRFYDLYGWWVVDNFQPPRFTRLYDVYYGAHYGLPTWTYWGTYYWTAPGGVTTKDDELDPQYMDEFGIGYERILTNKLSIGISYMHRAWKQKIEDYDLDGDGAWHFANETDFATTTTSWGKTFRKYDAVIVTLKKNLGDDKFQFLASYTWSKLKGFDGSDGEGTWGDDPYQTVNALGYLPNDVRHQVRFYGSFILPWDINFGVNLYWFSGYPYTDSYDMLWEDGGATGHDGQWYTYYADPRGESGRYPAEWRLDLRVEKKFRIKKLFTVSVYADIFNILNQQEEITRDNWLGEAELLGAVGSNDYVVTYNNPSYGTFTEWFAPLSIFIGAKVEW